MSTLVGRLTDADGHRRARRAEQTATWWPSWRTARTRRRWCVGAVVGMTAMALGAVLAVVAGGSLETRAVAVAFGVLWIGGTFGLVACWFVLQVLTGHVGELPTGVLDEREAAARNAARASGFQLGTYAALVPMVYLLFSARSGEASTTAWPGGLLVAVAVLVGSCSPTVLVAWRQVDDEPDEVG